MSKKEVPIALLTGYLGAGKTTLMNHILTNQQGYKVAVIVNDIGEVNIDAKLIQDGGFIEEEDKGNVVPLSNGCICCTLKEDLMNQILDILKTGKFDYILIEASGICEPLPIAQTIMILSNTLEKNHTPQRCRLDNIVTVVDALRLATEFGCGENLVKDNIDEEDIENLLIQQIEFCNTIIINKVDEVSEEELKKVKAVIRALQPVAKIIETNYAKVDVKEIIDTNNFDFEKAASSPAWVKELEAEDNEEDDDHDEDHDGEHEHEHHGHHHHHDEGEAEEYGIGTYVYTRRKGFDRNKFEQYVNMHWRKNIIRCKGIVWFTDEDDMSYVFEQAGNQFQMGEAGLWIASAPEKEKQEMINANPELAKNWDPDVGDRIIKLVFIGQNLDKENIKNELDDVLSK